MRSFLFDIGKVLVDFDLVAFASKVVHRSPGALARVLALRAHESLRAVETGRLSGEEYFESFLRPLAPAWTYRDLVQAWADVFTPNPVGMALMEELRDAGEPVGFLSNLAPFNAEAIEEKIPGFFSLSSRNFLSYEMGCMKPDAEIYRRACEGMGARPAECFFLDDTPECVDGARRAGLRAELFRTSRMGAIRRAIAEFTPGALADEAASQPMTAETPSM